MANLQIVPAANYNGNVEAQYVEMMVPLYSYGCEKKVKKTLSCLKGIYSVSVDYYQQKVTVWGICNKYDVLATMKSKRKEARFWNPEDNNINNVNSIQTLEDDDQSQEQEQPRSKKDCNFKPSLALIKARSFSWKAWKKVFTRSYSF